MRVLFIADAHLHQSDDANYRLLLRFIDQQRGKTDIVCILGDLFDFRIGLPQLTFPEHEPLLEALEKLSNSGTRLIYLEGNHDFRLGASFAQRIGCELYSGPTTLEMDGKRIYLCHGDLINPADWRYRLLYMLLRNKATFAAGSLMPERVVSCIRRRLQRASKKRYSTDSIRWDYGDIIRSYASELRKKGYDALVLGHFHTPCIETSQNFTLLCLGDWIGRFSYGLYEDGEFFLSSFSEAP